MRPKESEISNVKIGDGFDLAKLAGCVRQVPSPAGPEMTLDD
jgi:hypothetical protein